MGIGITPNIIKGLRYEVKYPTQSHQYKKIILYLKLIITAIWKKKRK